MRKQRSVLVLGRGGIGKSALLEHAAGILEVETLVVKLERVAPFANFLRDLFNRLFDARALDACTFLPDDALYADLEETRKLWMKFYPNNDTKARSLTDSLENYAARESRGFKGSSRSSSKTFQARFVPALLKTSNGAAQTSVQTRSSSTTHGTMVGEIPVRSSITITARDSRAAYFSSESVRLRAFVSLFG